jgi:hypothetical protein
LSDIGSGPGPEILTEASEPEAKVEEVMDAQEDAIDLSDLLNLLRETLMDHELRLMQIENFLNAMIEQIKAEQSVAESGDSESPEHSA